VAWKGLHLSEPAKLSFADGQAVVRRDDGEVRVPLEDLAWIVLDTQQATLSAALLSACMDAGVAIVVTDARHTPSGLALPFHRHHLQGSMAALQIEASSALKRRLWQAIVRRKIVNQAATLASIGHADAPTLKEIARRVEPGDPENVEARAARFYWPRLFPDFIRDNSSDRRNMLMNYGYAVVRAGVARALVASGFVPAFGLQHQGAANAFNLADDLFEPFRPFVDKLAWKTSDNGTGKSGDLTVEDRRAMAGALLIDARVGGEAVSLLVAAEAAAASLVRALQERRPDRLALPEFEVFA
jgi:CRISPR-associated protein Cas1